MQEELEGLQEPTATPAHHLATIGHEGRFWEVYMDFEDDPLAPQSCRARFRFQAGDMNEGEKDVRTAVIIIEPTYEDAMRKAKSFPDHQLVALLRSALPDPS